MSYDDDQKKMDMEFFVHNTLETYLAEYIVTLDSDKYEFMKSKLKSMCERYLSAEEIEELFKGY